MQRHTFAQMRASAAAGGIYVSVWQNMLALNCTPNNHTNQQRTDRPVVIVIVVVVRFGVGAHRQLVVVFCGVARGAPCVVRLCSSVICTQLI